AAVFMSNLDLWVANVALDSIGQDFAGSTLSGLSWVLNAYAIALAALLVVAGRTGDRRGHRPVFLAGIALFTLGSALCALAPNLPVLIAARALQAAGAAAQLPASLALLLAAAPVNRRTEAARNWSAVGGLAAALGPVLGGVLVQVDWRWVFLINIPVGIATLIAGALMLPRPAPRGAERRPDLVGAALLMVAIAALTGSLVQAPHWGWASGATLGLLALAVLAAALFVRRCATHPAPLLELPLLRIRRFAIANVANFVFGISFSIMLVSNALWCQNVWHYSALQTGLAMTPGPALVPLVTVASGRAVRRFGGGPVACLGSLLFMAAMLWRVWFAGPEPDYVRDLLPSMLLSGIGVGLAISTLVGVAATALPAHRVATGSAVVNAGRQVAANLGVAALVTLLGTSLDPAVLRGAFVQGWWLGAGLALVAAALSLALPRASADGPADAGLSRSRTADGSPRRRAAPAADSSRTATS
ncbi:MAG TPA: DHA2 family efflux MFS transporter permease subunit, partial [Pseudonocardia sp.]|nr:DHA2 family efflux MFS transporter permease subunit [Pseudonocardia sp.]